MDKRSSSTSRHQWTEADARRVLADWKRSGITLEAFARARGLVPQRLAWWRKRLGITSSEPSTSLTFVPAAVIGSAAAAAGPAAMIRLPHGIVIELEDATLTTAPATSWYGAQAPRALLSGLGRTLTHVLRAGNQAPNAGLYASSFGVLFIPAWRPVRR